MPSSCCNTAPLQRAIFRSGFTLLELLIALAIVGLLAAVAIPSYGAYVERARIAQATVDIKGIEQVIERFYVIKHALPDDLGQIGQSELLDPWGNPYRYLNVTTANRGKMRKDRALVPINSDYDLYSMGADGLSQPPLTARASHDDIVRANNGRFVGLASDY